MNHEHLSGDGIRRLPESARDAQKVLAPSNPLAELRRNGELICVLGMHRSGTSVISRLLNILGVDLGPADHLMAPSRFNPTGFWEHQGIVDLNDAILDRFGGSWRHPPELPPGWHAAPRLADLRARAAALLVTDFGSSAMWGFKDPRTCITLPFWRQLTPPSRYVIPVRNPVDVARSLEHAMPLDEAIALWSRYMRLAIAHSAGEPRLFVLYDELMRAWHLQTRRLAAFIGREEVARRPDTTRAVREFVGGGHWHHRASFLNVVEDRTLAFSAKALYTVIRLAVERDARPGAGPSADRVIDAFSAST